MEEQSKIKRAEEKAQIVINFINEYQAQDFKRDVDYPEYQTNHFEWLISLYDKYFGQAVLPIQNDLLEAAIEINNLIISNGKFCNTAWHLKLKAAIKKATTQTL